MMVPLVVGIQVLGPSVASEHAHEWELHQNRRAVRIQISDLVFLGYTHSSEIVDYKTILCLSFVGCLYFFLQELYTILYPHSNPQWVLTVLLPNSYLFCKLFKKITVILTSMN